MACLLSGHDCKATLRLVGDEASDSLMIRGSNIGCHGHSASTLCCGIDMLSKHVIAVGTLEQAELGPALVVASVCAAAELETAWSENPPCYVPAENR
ncbi:MAG: hypothetical protein HOV81_14990 [Kofleriaceae bacterium]|nr:hypothetical protein [Kofleriaceae bacterium]